MNAKEEVVQLARRRSAAVVARDARTMEAILSAEYVYTNSLGKVLRKADYLRNMSDPDIIWKSQDLQVEEVLIRGDTAVLVGTVHDVAKFGTMALDETFRTTHVFARTAAGWVCVAGHTSSISREGP